MRRSARQLLFAGLVLGLGRPASADLIREVQAEMAAASARPTTAGEGGEAAHVELVGEHGAGRNQTTTALASSLFQQVNSANRVTSMNAPTVARVAAEAVPEQNRPWMLHWFPYTSCHLSFWRTGDQPLMSPLEKYDTWLKNKNAAEPYAAAFEGTDARPWVANAFGLKPGQNLAAAVKENNGDSRAVPWWNWNGREWVKSTADVSWWGHCNGWSAASVAFKESLFERKQIPISTRRILKRPQFELASNGMPYQNGQPVRMTLNDFYSDSASSSMWFFEADAKALLVEYGMQLRPNPAYTSGTRYNAPTMDIEESFFDRQANGTVVVPADAQYLWLVVEWPGGRQALYVANGYANEVLLDWKTRVINYYKAYVGNNVTAKFVARFTNIPSDPDITALERLPVPVRKSFLDMSPRDFKTRLMQTVGEGNHGLIVEVMAGSQVWNYPIIQFKDTLSEVRESPFRSADDVNRMWSLSRQADNLLVTRGSQAVIRYRLGTLECTYQRPSPHVQSDGTRTDTLPATYTYYEFLDASDRVVSTTWQGESVKTHPDFCWFPDLNTPGNPAQGNPYIKAQYLNELIPTISIR